MLAGLGAPQADTASDRGVQRDSEAGRAARRAPGAFGHQEKGFNQRLTYTKNPRIPSSLNILPMALNTPLPGEEKSSKRAGAAPAPSHAASHALCSHQPQQCPPQPPCQRCSRQLWSAASPQPVKGGRGCALPAGSNTRDKAQLADNCSNAEARRALLGFVGASATTTAHNVL